MPVWQAIDFVRFLGFKMKSKLQQGYLVKDLRSTNDRFGTVIKHIKVEGKVEVCWQDDVVESVNFQEIERLDKNHWLVKISNKLTYFFVDADNI